MKLREFIFTLIFLSELLTGVYSQPAVRPFVINHDTREYQADYQNWSVSVAPGKQVYAGNNQGLLIFNGADWTLKKMPEELIVRSVSALNDSMIYVGAFEEFGFWKKNLNGKLTYISLSDSLERDVFHNDEIWRIIPHKGKIYFQSFRSIFIYDGVTVDRIHPGFSIVLLQKANDRLFIHGVDHGLYELTGTQLRYIPSSQFLSNDEIKVVLPYGKDEFLLGAANNGLFIYDGDQIHPWTNSRNIEIRNAEINKGIKTKDYYVIGTIVDGIYIFDQSGRLLQHLNTNNLLQNNTVLALEPDGGNNFWVGLDNGIDYVKMDSDLDFYFDESGRIGTVFSASLFEDRLFIGTNRGLYMYYNDPVTGYCCPELIQGSQGQVRNLKIFDGELLCGHSNGTYKVSGSKLTKISDFNGGYQLEKIESGNQLYLLQSTYSPLVIYEQSENGWRFSRTVRGFLEPITHFEIDYLGNVWGNHAIKGIFKLRLNNDLDSVNSVEYVGRNQGLPTERKLFVSKLENRIVISTGMGIYTYDDLRDTVINYQQLNAQLSEYSNAQRIIPVGKNQYWFILEDKVGLFLIDNFLIQKIFEYNLGQHEAYLSSNFPEIVVLNDSLNLFCLDNGFGIFHKNRIAKNYPPPRAGLHEIKILNNQGKSRFLTLKSRSETMEIAHQFRNIQFKLSTDQRIPQPEFSYFLDGLEESWNDWSVQSTVDYTRLPYGEYIFKVKTRNIRCTESEVINYPFDIKPPVYASAPAKFFYIFLVLSGGVLLRILFIRRLKKQTRRLTAIEKEKREKERIQAEQKYIKLKNEKLSSELKHQNVQLANRAMTIIQKNEFLTKLKNELIELKSGFDDPGATKKLQKFLRLIDNQISSGEDWREFEVHFDQANQDFFKRLKTGYPELTPNDLRLCAYLRMNLSSKEIAPLLNISVRGVEIKRYRLRKRLNLHPEDNLIDFLLTF